MYSLCPDGPLTPKNLLDVMLGHSRRSLTSAGIGAEYRRPIVQSADEIYVHTEDEGSTDKPYPFVLFGQIAREPEKYGGWPGRIVISLVSPNWTGFGWHPNLFKDDFGSQVLAMRYLAIVERDADVAVGKVPATGKWPDDDLTIEIRPTSPPEYIVSGDRSALLTGEIPFSTGDTVIAECTLHRLQVDLSGNDHWRGYSLVAQRIKRVHIAPMQDISSPSASGTDISSQTLQDL